MKKYILLFCVIGCFGTLLGRSVATGTLKIKNEENTPLAVSFGHSTYQITDQMKAFVVWIAPKSVMEIKDWVLSEAATLIFVCTEKAKDYDYGYLYRMPGNKSVAVTYSVKKGLRPSSIFASAKNIQIFCNVGSYEAAYLAISACVHPRPQAIKREAGCNVFDLRNAAEKNALQNYISAHVR